MLAYTRFEIMKTMRNARFVAISTLVPSIIYLIFNGIFGNAHIAGIGYSKYILVSMACYGALVAATGANTGSLPAERASGWTRLLRITPLSPSTWLAAKLIQAIVLVIPGSILVSLCGILVGHVSLGPEQWAGLFALVILGSAPFALLGLILGLVLDAQAAQPVQGFLMMLLGFGGGLFFPSSMFPSVLHTISEFLPSYQIGQLGRELVGGQAINPLLPLVMAAWVVVLGGAALVVWRRGGALRGA
ncbi:MAG TPA: ABC transporter permease [Candidatus Dormibacteraeota bacterium]|jgi:ABC-2 type transport system permease protein|nr:ABC transporter permease [Candidatus Dormibacteraeota bacterium]